MSRFKGRLLVAAPLLGDPNFERSVVLLLEHSEEGALGLVLNRPSELEVADPLPEWRRFTGSPEVVFVGGPVSRGSVIALARLGRDLPAGAWEPVLGRVGVLDLTGDPDVLGSGLDDLRVFAGYAGWGSGQLEDEIDEGAWYVVDADPADAFTAVPAGLWRTVLRRQGGELAKVALVPPEPRLN